MSNPIIVHTTIAIKGVATQNQIRVANRILTRHRRRRKGLNYKQEVRRPYQVEVYVILISLCSRRGEDMVANYAVSMINLIARLVEIGEAHQDWKSKTTSFTVIRRDVPIPKGVRVPKEALRNTHEMDLQLVIPVKAQF